MTAIGQRGAWKAWAGHVRIGILVCASMIGASSIAFAQFGQWIAPGPLAQAHAKLSGAENCRKCHTPGGATMKDLCLSCHKAIADRIGKQAGVHRAVKNDCRPCHIEHRGPGGDLRPFNQATFDHVAETGFALEGRHAEFSRECARCHKTRSFLGMPTTCVGCHADGHKPTLGGDCTKCHSVGTPFKQTRTQFDHTKAAYTLAGAHQRVDCAKCHVNKVYKGLKFARCVDCHRSPHRQPFAADTCMTCHSNETWKTTKVDHARTPFLLKGKHAELTCAKCHVQSPTRAALKFDRCATCHQDPHKGTFKQDCNACHNEAGFRRGNFDHDKNTKFPLTGKHAESLACVKCHKNVKVGGLKPSQSVDFRGLSTACVSCHADVHKTELGAKCDTCHTPATFKLPDFKHPRLPEFFAGQHQTVACGSCHIIQKPGEPKRVAASIDAWTFKNKPTACASCHTDVHLGQLGTACEKCHTIEAAKFAPTLFAHAKAAFQLTGKHETVECRKCHKSETGAFPSGRGTAVRLKGLATTCESCHKDQHLGQLGNKCDTCHTTAGFKLPSYTHAVRKDFFVGKHATKECIKCHKVEEGAFPAGRGTTVRYKGSAGVCVTCHADDNHRGALGRTCETCHNPNGWKNGSRAFHKVGVFPLEGRHLTVECAACHWNGTLKGTPTRCDQCHWTRRQDDRFQTRLGIECGKCHRPTSWAAVNWNHATMTGVQLTPAHRALGCEGCHKDQNFAPSSVLCISCHAEDYKRTLSPAHQSAGFPTSCEACHLTSQTTWSQARFDHQATYQLVGMHATQPCAACHKGGVFKGTATDCFGCHKTDYDRSQNPNHAAAGFPTTCISCHQNSDPDWHGRPFNHSLVFPLAGVHTTQACAACHKNGVYRGTSTDCYGCHKTDYEKTQNPNHVSAGFATSCEGCHRFSDSGWHASPFNHNLVFPLPGVHAAQACATCHKNGVYKGTSRECFSCHKPDYDRSQNPNHLTAGFSTNCDICHRMADPDWHTQFNHSNVYPLVGMHATQACTVCHKNGVYKGTATECYGCHRTDYEQSKNPSHVAAGFPTTCQQCHRPSDLNWRSTFNHNTVFQLVGVHASQPCTSCHKNGVYGGTPRDCYGCHKTDYEKTLNPNHLSAGFSTQCDTCHRPTDPNWHTTFNHSQFFQLVGTHATQPCTSCHKNGIYKGTPRDCYGCHKTDYDRTTNPNHIAAGFPTTCDSCHNAASPSWSASFNHNAVFQLVGTHATQPCSACHVNNVYKGTPRDCYGCHRTNYERTTNPNHVAAGFPTTCDSCHNAASPSWTASFNHNAVFQLVGTHATQPCAACHINNVYKGTPRDCYGCHRTNYERTTNPNHVAAGFPTTCDSCHSPSAATWTASFNHNAVFQLVGVHATQPCTACHINNVYHGTPRDCYGCHRTNYERTTNPNHVAAGFPTTCDSCHSPSATTWTASFNHNAVFQLVGVHATQPCTACHINNVYHGTPRVCYGCHRTNYERTTNPNHLAAGFPTTCDSCHNPASATWTSSFDHNTIFPLLGRHLTAPCTQCHVNNVYHGTPRDCFSCHQTNYNNTTNPNHRGAGFPTTCEVCHQFSDSSWTLGRFTHSAFPISSGRHAGNACSVCHIDPNNYKTFSCLTGCHPKSSTDSHHVGRSGYRYDSVACYSCHPRGSS